MSNGNRVLSLPAPHGCRSRRISAANDNRSHGAEVMTCLSGGQQASVGGISLVTLIPLVVAPTRDVESIGGDSVGVHEERPTPHGVDRAQIFHAARRGPFEGMISSAGVGGISNHH